MPEHLQKSAAPPSLPSEAPAECVPASTDDMNDSAEIHDYKRKITQGHQEQFRPLYAVLSLLQDTVYEPFTRCDKQAIHSQKCYQHISIAAVVGGAATIVCAILEFIVKPWLRDPITYTEVSVALITLVLIAFGIIGKYKEKWLTARYKAENLRLLKFQKLTDSRLWCPPLDMSLLKEELQDDVRKLESQTYDDARAWSSKGVHPRVFGPPCVGTCDEALHELVEYYRPKRLRVQMDYLARKSEVNERRGAWTATVVRWVFFMSFAFVLAHLMLHLHARYEKRESSLDAPAAVAAGAVVAGAKTIGAGKNSGSTPAQPDEDLFTKCLIAAAAGLPVIAAGFRSYRGAREFERNALRHRATLDSLEALEDQLRASGDLSEKFQLLGFCELVLEMDCRDFMRLLCEVEWYG